MQRPQHRLFLFALLSITLALGCRRDPCKRMDCGAGSCLEGVCQCPTGFEGEGCTTPVSQKYIGSYTLEEACTAGSDSYTAIIEAVSGSNTDMRVTGLWEKPQTLQATVVDNGSEFVIARQAITTAQDIIATGQMSEDGTQVIIDYFIYSTGNLDPFDHCQATLSR